MDDRQTPITRDSKIRKVLPCIEDKFVVDLVNGIDVAKAHLRVQDFRSGFLNRMYDGFTGKDAQRQTNISVSLTDALEGLRQWFTDLTEEQVNTNAVMARHGLALARIDEKVGKLHDGLELLARNTSTRRELRALAKEFNSRLNTMGAWVASVEAEKDAKIDLDRIISKWKAGHYEGLSILGQCYAALEELRWGTFGYYCQAHKGDSRRLLETLANEAIVQILERAPLPSKGKRVETADWLQQPKEPLMEDGAEALAYLGEGCRPPRNFPLVYVVTQSPPSDRCWPLDAPHIISADRAANGLVDEIFQEKQHE